jgi:hypothetical protein
MLFSLSPWDVGPIIGNTRNVCGHNTTVRLLPMRERYDLGVETVAVGAAIRDSDMLSVLSNPVLMPFIERLCDLTDYPHDGFEDDLTAQMPVAMTALEVNLAGFFPDARLALSASHHKAVRKAFKKEEHGDAAKIGPTVRKYWFLYRPVMADVCTYESMFIDERFSFYDIHQMHELLDVKQFSEMVANDTDDN